MSQEPHDPRDHSEYAPAPARIWLQDAGDYEGATLYALDEGGVTWCANPMDDGDTAYVRADLFDALAAERDALREALVQAKDVEHWHPNPCDFCAAIDRALTPSTEP